MEDLQEVPKFLGLLRFTRKPVFFVIVVWFNTCFWFNLAIGRSLAFIPIIIMAIVGITLESAIWTRYSSRRLSDAFSGFVVGMIIFFPLICMVLTVAIALLLSLLIKPSGFLIFWLTGLSSYLIHRFGIRLVRSKRQDSVDPSVAAQ